MHVEGTRKNGGVGFAISEPSCLLDVRLSSQFELTDCRDFPFTDTEARQLSSTVESTMSKFRLASGVSVKLTGPLRTHVGLGSATAIRLGVLEGLFHLNGRPISAQELVSQSNRGGTSGVGINTYFSGGMVHDLGVPNDRSDFIPSSRGVSPRRPSSLPVLEMPNWPLRVCIPNFIRPKTQDEEASFFSRAAPVEPTSSYEAAYHALFGVYAAVSDKDFSTFCKAITAMQAVAWKKHEWSQYGDVLWQLATRLQDYGADCVGMSSLGPLLYCFGNDQALRRIDKNAATLNCDVFHSLPSNSGRALLDL